MIFNQKIFFLFFIFPKLVNPRRFFTILIFAVLEELWCRETNRQIILLPFYGNKHGRIFCDCMLTKTFGSGQIKYVCIAHARTWPCIKMSFFLFFLVGGASFVRFFSNIELSLYSIFPFLFFFFFFFYKLSI